MKLIIKIVLIVAMFLLLAERYKNLDVVGQQTVQLSKDVEKLNESMAQVALLDSDIYGGVSEESEPLSEIQLQQIARQKAWEEKNSENYVKLGGVVMAKAQLPINNTKELDCKSWQNSHLLEPTPIKEKYLQQHCQHR